MLLTNQQKTILDMLEKLGGARTDQLITLLRPVYCACKPEAAPQIARAAIRQMFVCNIPLCKDGDTVYLPGRKPTMALLEAVDVMLELSGDAPMDFARGNAPILLRFTAQRQKERLFCIVDANAAPYGAVFAPTERIILLFDGQSPRRALPVSNKQIYAVRQGDGIHRFYVCGEEGGDPYAEKESG